MTPKKSLFTSISSSDSVGSFDKSQNDIGAIIVKNLLSDLVLRKVNLFREGGTAHSNTFLLTYSLTQILTLLTNALTHARSHSLTYLLTQILTYSLTHSLTHSNTYANAYFTYLGFDKVIPLVLISHFTESDLYTLFTFKKEKQVRGYFILTHSLTHSLTHPFILTYSRTYSRTHP